MATQRSGASKRPTARPSARTAKTRPADSYRSPLAGVPSKYHTLIFVGMILLSLIVFFGGVIFGGKFFATSDNISWLSFLPYLDHVDKSGELPFWVPYIFSGMPGLAAYLVTGDRWWDLSMKILGMAEHIFAFTNYWTLRVIFHYFIYGTGMYLLMRSKKAARSTSLFVSLAAMFSTWIIVYIMIGHNTKVAVLMSFPFLFICLERLLKRWSLLYAGLLILVVHMMTEAAHPQTALYGVFAVAIYLLFELVGGLMAKEKGTLTSILRVGAVLLVAGAFAYGMGLDRYLALEEYTPYSTRGSSAISGTDNGQKEEAGHGYDYATNFSFSPEEMITFFNPSYYGFGGETDYSGPATGGQAQRIRTYFGQMPFTDAAHYVGMAVLILGVFGAWTNRRSRFVQALIVIGLFGLVLSFGKNMSLLYDLFYNYFPSFSKLRAPSQSLILLEFVFPILAGFGIETLIAMHKSGDNPQVDKTVLYTGYAFAAVCLLGIISASASKASYIASIAKSPLGQYPPEIQEFIYGKMQTDWFLAALFGLATIALMYLYAKSRISPTVFKVGLLTVLIIDLWRVDYRPMNAVPVDEAFAVFNPTDVDAFLKQDTSKYRILDVTQHPNYPARQFHENIIGYSSAKMRVYQDLLDIAGNGDVPTAPLAWDILNAKYIIADQPIAPGMQPVFESKQKKASVYLNSAAMPRAWFVNRLDVADGKKTLEMLRDNKFDPRDVAYLIKPISEKIDPVGYSGGVAATDTTIPHDSTHPAQAPAATPARGSVSFTSYEPNHFSLEVDAPGPGNNFLVLSEIYYPASWRATIDGKPAEIIQTNYLLRGLVVPAGKHKIEMHFESKGFETGKYASLGLNLVMFGIIGAGIMTNRRRPEDADPEHDAPVIDENDV